MSEQVQGTEQINPYEDIRGVILDLELIAHADLSEHRTGEHISAQLPDEFGGHHYDFTHTPLNNEEWTNLCPTMTVSQGEHFWRYRLLEGDRVEMVSADSEQPEADSETHADGMLHAMRRLHEIAVKQRNFCLVDSYGLPDASELHASYTPVEQVWRLVGQLYLQVYGTAIEVAEDAPGARAMISVLINANGKPYTRNLQFVPLRTTNDPHEPVHYEIATHQGFAAEQAGYQLDGDAIWRLQFEGQQREPGDESDITAMVRDLGALVWWAQTHPKQVYIDGKQQR